MATKSKFSDFFNVIGSSGDFPINTYLPLSAESSNNPIGYNPTTGLYQTPWGEEWLETGKVIDYDESEYPNATISQQQINLEGSSIDTSAQITSRIGVSLSGSNTVWVQNWTGISTPDGIFEYSFPVGVFTGNILSLPLGDYRSGFAISGSTFYVSSLGGVTKFDKAGNNLGNFVSYGSTIIGTSFVTLSYIESLDQFHLSSQTNGAVVVYSSSGTLLNSIDLNSLQGLSAMSNPIYNTITGELWLVETATKKVYVYDTNYNFTGNVYTLQTTNTINYILWDGSNLWGASGRTIYKFGTTVTKKVGDPVSRTSSDTGKALFVKLA